MSKQPRLPRQQGFSLIELMIAITLGLLLMLGITTLFTNTNNTNRTQDALARMQENGRYAVTRLMDDIRSGVGQPLGVSVSSANQQISANGVIVPPLAAMVHVANLQTRLPRWIAADGTVAPTGWPANTPYPLSPRWFLQGHECNVGAATCTPAVPAELPAVGTGAGNRVQGGDVITVRYINSPGWSLAVGNTIQTCNAANDIVNVVVDQVVNRPATNFVTGDLAMVWGGGTAAIFQVTVTGAPGAQQVLTPVNLVGGTPVSCWPTVGVTPPTLYNFSRDLRSVTYFLQLLDDPNPDAIPANRVIPTLMRWNGTDAQPEVVASGVERLDFLYAVEGPDSRVNYLTANQVQANSSVAACTAPPRQYPSGTVEPGCLWRSVRTIEVHALLNTVNDVFSLLPSDEAFRYSMTNGTALAYTTPAIPTALLPNGLNRGRMMRREFTTQIALRNNLP